MLLARDDPKRAAQALRDALAVWRGFPLADVSSERFAQAEISRLEELRLACLEERVDADLALGLDRELVAELSALVHAHPRRERLRGQLMLALYRSGRQEDALELYRTTHNAMIEEIGLEPGPELQALERAILNQDPELGGPPALLVAGRDGVPAWRWQLQVCCWSRRLPARPWSCLQAAAEQASATCLRTTWR